MFFLKEINTCENHWLKTTNVQTRLSQDESQDPFLLLPQITQRVMGGTERAESIQNKSVVYNPVVTSVSTLGLLVNYSVVQHHRSLFYFCSSPVRCIMNTAIKKTMCKEKLLGSTYI